MKKLDLNKKQLIHGLLEYGLLIAATFVIYRLWARPAALEFRGSTALGGEVCVFAIPLVWGAVKGVIRDIRGSAELEKEETK